MLNHNSNCSLIFIRFSAFLTCDYVYIMEFHPQKCHVIPIARNINFIDNKYMLHGQLLETVSQAKYLGFTITSDLRWNTHINIISSKSKRPLRFPRKNLQVTSIKIKTQAYFAFDFARPLLENGIGIPIHRHKYIS